MSLRSLILLKNICLLKHKLLKKPAKLPKMCKRRPLLGRHDNLRRILSKCKQNPRIETPYKQTPGIKPIKV